MKRFIPFLLLAALLSGCSHVSERAEQLGHDLLSAWGDTAVIKAIDRQYQAAIDSLNIPGTSGMFSSAFIDAVGDRDSLKAVAEAIALDAEAFADQHAKPLINGLLDGSMDARKATDQLFLLHWAADVLGKTQHIEVLDQAIDKAANKLSMEKQMLLYSRASSPAALGKQMRAEVDQNGVDAADMERRAEVLHGIYNEAQWEEFQSEFSTKH